MALAARDAFKVVEQFEEALAAYTGAPYVVTVDSCTNALFLAFRHQMRRLYAEGAYIPANTYAGVVRAARNAGLMVEFVEEHWTGEHEIKNLGIIDAAKWFRKKMYRPTTITCVSFQASKQLPIGRGGAILTDSASAYEWLKRAAFDGRVRGMSLYDQSRFQEGYHMYLDPPSCARGLWLMSGLEDDAEPIGSWLDYPDLREKEWT